MQAHWFQALRLRKKEEKTCEEQGLEGGVRADPTFPVLFYENPTLRTFFIAIPNPVFSFPKIHLKKE